MLILGRRYLENTLCYYLAHYDTERAHRSLALAARGRAVADEDRGSPLAQIGRRDVLGGMLHEYLRHDPR